MNFYYSLLFSFSVFNFWKIIKKFLKINDPIVLYGQRLSPTICIPDKWQNSEFGMFVHFGINIFNNKEWSDGTLSPKMFNQLS